MLKRQGNTPSDEERRESHTVRLILLPTHQGRLSSSHGESSGCHCPWLFAGEHNKVRVLAACTPLSTHPSLHRSLENLLVRPTMLFDNSGTFWFQVFMCGICRSLEDEDANYPPSQVLDYVLAR